MQITNVQVIPVELRLPFRTAYQPEEIDRVTVVFVRVETQQGQTAWGCAAFDPNLTGETLADVVRACRACADQARDLTPPNTEHALEALAQLTEDTPSALCAFDLAFHDLLGLGCRDGPLGGLGGLITCHRCGLYRVFRRAWWHLLGYRGQVRRARRVGGVLFATCKQ